MFPKLGLACLCVFSCLSTIMPALAQSATDISVNQIAPLEVKIFAHTYNQEALPQRVARLERFAFGQASNRAINERISRLVSQVKVTNIATKLVAAAPSPRVTQVPVAQYPRVTELEQQLLERSFESDEITARLARMEAKVFGNACTEVDLAARVDRLAEYAFITPKVEELEYAEYLRVSNLRNIASRPKQVFISVVDEIESLETLAFGKISANLPLEKRVVALEVNICGAPQTDKDRNLTARVSALLTRVGSGPTSRLGV